MQESHEQSVENPMKLQIERHKTAIKRYKISKPVKLLVENDVLSEEESFFDYGAGHLEDVKILNKCGYTALGWDPYFHKAQKLVDSDVVNLGYVLNVIEDPVERGEALSKAFSLAKRVLCVSVMTKLQQGYDGKKYSDGVISSRGTFQKYYDQSEIYDYIQSCLQHEPVSLEPGIFLVFKEEKDRLQFLEQKSFRKRKIDHLATLEKNIVFQKQSVLDEIKTREELPEVLSFVMTYGRCPEMEESREWRSLTKDFSSAKKLQSAILSLVDIEKLKEIREERKQGLSVFFSIRRFDKLGYPKLNNLPGGTVKDIKDFYGSYKDFLKISDALLFSVGKAEVVKEAFRGVKLGKHLPDAIYIHTYLIDKMPPEIRVLIGLASSFLGDVEGCNILKINKVKRKITFLVYEDFDKVAHPALQHSFVVDLQQREIKRWEFAHRESPPILHRKETFVDETYPAYKKFKKLTDQEEKNNLLSRNDIGTRLKWEAFLKENGFEVKGHQLKTISS